MMAEQDVNGFGTPDGSNGAQFVRPGRAQEPQPVYDPGAAAADVPPYEQTARLPQGAYPAPTGSPYAQGYGQQAYAQGAPAQGGPAQNGYGQNGYGQAPYGQPFGQSYGPAGQYPPAQPPRKRSAMGRMAFAVGSLAAIGILATSTGLLNPNLTSTTGNAGGGTGPVASAPAQSGNSGNSGTSGSGSGTSGSGLPQMPDPGTGQSGSAGNVGTGTSSSSAKTNATAAQTKGVVLINTTMPSGEAAGSGMVIDAGGYVLTNYHVVQGSTAVKVTVVASSKAYTATVVGHDATNDVALLKLQGASGLDTVTLDNDAVSNGQDVVAVGNAEGQGYLTAASGQITDTAATVTVSNDSATGTETLKNVYETNAQAQPGDSGGPLFDTQNEVTGMTTAGEQTYAGPGGRSGRSGSSSSGSATTVASYAIPIARAMSVVKQIETGTSSGTVVVGANPYLGITVSSRGGAVVQSVGTGTPAQKAGLTTGSQITSLAGKSVSSQATIAAALAGHKPGDSIEVAWSDAQGDAHTATVVLGSSPLN